MAEYTYWPEQVHREKARDRAERVQHAGGAGLAAVIAGADAGGQAGADPGEAGGAQSRNRLERAVLATWCGSLLPRGTELGV